MALKVIYEGIPAGELNLDATCLSTAGNAIYAGMLCQLNASGDVIVGTDNTIAVVSQTFPTYGIVADDKDDIIASGKVTVYVTPGKYSSDQIVTAAKASLVVGDEITIGVGSTANNCLIDEATVGDYACGFVTKAYSAANPWIEFMFTGVFVSL